MPTYAWSARFKADFDSLSPGQQAAFLVTAEAFVADLRSSQGFRKELRVKGVKAAPGVFEMTWSANGRATFEYAESIVHGQAHIIWRRVGTHAIVDQP